jgi:hypothetical protein
MAGRSLTAGVAAALGYGIVAVASTSMPCDTDGQVYTSCPAPFEFVGPYTYVNGFAGDVTQANNMTSAGAMQRVVRGSTDSEYFVGSANGGIWRSADIDELVPHWENVLDGQNVSCTSISALTGPTASSPVMYAGCGGSTSSEMGKDWNVLNSGSWKGLMSSADGGKTWGMTNFPPDYYITAIEALTVGTTIAVSARSNFHDPNSGGVWLSSDGGASWTQTLDVPVFDLAQVDTGGAGSSLLLAGVPFSDHVVQASADGGKTWAPWDTGIDWSVDGEAYQPFYPCFAVSEASTATATAAARGPVVFVGALTVSPSKSTATASAIFHRELAPPATTVTPATAAEPDGLAGWGVWEKIANQPENLDDDAMPKDRMALLADPRDAGTLYVAGNGDSIGLRVRWAANTTAANGTVVGPVWEDLVEGDTPTGYAPHCDCRNLAWHHSKGSLLLVSDGGVFERQVPGAKMDPGAKWRSINGDVGGMELLTAHWDYRLERFVAGAQDNDVQIGPPRSAETHTPAFGFVFGDGTTTAVDNVANPARLYGARQFAGQYSDDQVTGRRHRRAKWGRRAGKGKGAGGGDTGDDDDDDGGGGGIPPGLQFASGDGAERVVMEVPLTKWFPQPAAFPFFQHPFTLNTVDPQELVVWTAETAANASGFWTVRIPHGISNSSQIEAPVLAAPVSSQVGAVYDFVAGGTTGGQPDKSVLAGANATHFFHRAGGAGSAIRAWPLPAKFASPLVFGYDKAGQPIVGPVSHGKTVSVAVSPADSSLVAVTGWPSVDSNDAGGAEGVWTSGDGGRTWANVVGNLLPATASAGARARPSGLLFVDFPQRNASALLAGTVSGVYVSWTDRPGQWSRFGGCDDLPLVMVAGLSHEAVSDTLVAATMGRGVYVLHGLRGRLQVARKQQESGSCELPLE